MKNNNLSKNSIRQWAIFCIGGIVLSFVYGFFSFPILEIFNDHFYDPSVYKNTYNSIPDGYKFSFLAPFFLGGNFYLNFYKSNGFGFDFLYKKSIGSTAVNLIRFILIYSAILAWGFFVYDDINCNGNIRNCNIKPIAIVFIQIVPIILALLIYIFFNYFQNLFEIPLKLARALLVSICIWHIILLFIKNNSYYYIFNILKFNFIEYSFVRSFWTVLPIIIFIVSIKIFRWINSDELS